jgi:hypothetical protein
MTNNRLIRNTNTGSSQLTIVMTPEASDTLSLLQERLTEMNKGYRISTSEVIRRAIMHLEQSTRATSKEQ